MDMPWVTVGTVIGVAATVAIARINQKTLSQRELLREEIRTRETLYGEFVGECARLLVDAFQHTLEKPEPLLPAYALLARIRMCASHEVLAAEFGEACRAERSSFRAVWQPSARGRTCDRLLLA